MAKSAMLKLQVFRVTTILLFISSCAYAGGWSSGGGGRTTDEGNPWFLGEAPIPYCVKVAPGFPVSKEKVTQEIREAFDQWNTVFKRYGLYHKNLPGKFSDGKSRYITTEAIEIPICDDRTHQLEFKIGFVDQEVSQFFEENSKATVGLAQHREYDHQTFRTGGYIWIAPDDWIDGKELNMLPVKRFPVWEEKPTRFNSILIHEIGHVLGFPHLAGSVMDETIFSHLVYDHWYPNVTMRPVSGEIETETYSLNPLVARSSIEFQDCAWAAKILADETLFDDCSNMHLVFASEGGGGVIGKMTLIDARNDTEVSASLSVSTGNWQNTMSFQSIGFFSPHYRPAYSEWDLFRETILPLFDGNTVMKGAFHTSRIDVPVTVRFNSTLTVETFDPVEGWRSHEAASPSM
jgi:hypothetical protein